MLYSEGDDTFGPLAMLISFHLFFFLRTTTLFVTTCINCDCKSLKKNMTTKSDECMQAAVHFRIGKMVDVVVGNNVRVVFAHSLLLKNSPR